jgi:hypothetical protein
MEVDMAMLFKLLFKPILALWLLLGIPVVGYVAYTATQQSGNSGGSSSSGSKTLHNAPPVSTTTPRGVPGPIAGAGLPVLAVGYGVCWLVRRRRRSQ